MLYWRGGQGFFWKQPAVPIYPTCEKPAEFSVLTVHELRGHRISLCSQQEDLHHDSRKPACLKSLAVSKQSTPNIQHNPWGGKQVNADCWRINTFLTVKSGFRANWCCTPAPAFRLNGDYNTLFKSQAVPMTERVDTVNRGKRDPRNTGLTCSDRVTFPQAFSCHFPTHLIRNRMVFLEFWWQTHLLIGFPRWQPQARQRAPQSNFAPRLSDTIR